MSENHSGNSIPAITQEEHIHVNGAGGKKVVVLDSQGNQVTSFSAPTITHLPLSYYRHNSLVSGYVFHGHTTPGSNPTVSVFRIMRETLNTGEVLFGSGTPQFVHQWSAASLASLSWL